MNNQLQVRVHGVDDVRLDRVDYPQAGPDDIIVNVVACGICGSDLGYIGMGGLTPPGTPMPLGHELAGTVESVGENVGQFTVGQRVTVNPMANGHAIGNGGSEGGFTPRLLVRDVAHHPDAVLVLPEELDFEQGALIEPLAVAMHGVNQSGASKGKSVLVLGAGPIGLCTVLVLRHRGIEEIAVADRSARRLAIASELGAATICQVDNEDLAGILKQAHGAAELMGAPLPATDIYIEATGVGAVLEQAIALARPGATVTVVGVHKAPIQLDPLTLLMKELHLVGAMAYPDEFPAVIEMLKSDKVDTSPLISHRLPLEQFNEALAIAGDPNRGAKIMIQIDPEL